MTQGYYAGLSGIQTHQYGIDVVSDNLANVNTIGYRGSSTEFASLLSEKITGAGAQTPTSNDVEAGVRLQATTLNTTTGTTINTDRFNDLSLSGNGWFGVSNGSDNYFTRAGNFVFDEYQKTPGDINSSTARLTTADGMYVTGTMLSNFSYDTTNDYEKSLTVNPNATDMLGAFVLNTATTDVPFAASDSQVPLEFPTKLAYPVQPTTTTSFYGNLGQDNATRTMSADAISGASNHNRVKLVFTKSAIQPDSGIAWDISATVTSNDGQVTYDTQQGNALFTAAGLLQSSNIPTLNNDGSPITVDLGSTLGGVTSSFGVAISASSKSDGTL
ncbi:MAG: flagellar hook protein FlgE, partial [Campylobacterota bacterium]|nr:flagellar hook protein FlgE [Campylobacterota bacterium]